MWFNSMQLAKLVVAAALPMMSLSDDDEDKLFARLPESKVSSEEDEEETKEQIDKVNSIEKDGDQKEGDRNAAKTLESEVFTKLPAELFRDILKYLSSKDLVSCSLVCKSLNFAASDESLWRCLYAIRWGPSLKLRECTWKKLYFYHDKRDLDQFLNRRPVVKEYYTLMHAVKRIQPPRPSGMVDDHILHHKTILEQVWKKIMGLTNKVVTNHDCSGAKCNHHQLGDMFICRETGYVHVCDDNCKEDSPESRYGLSVCTILGHCFDDKKMFSSVKDPLAKAFELGYNCKNEQELERILRRLC